MIQVETEDSIVTFDGTVVEYFRRNGSDRYHVRFIKEFELVTDRKGRGQLRVAMERAVTDGMTVTAYVKPEHMGRAEELVSAVEQAMAAHRASG